MELAGEGRPETAGNSVRNAALAGMVRDAGDVAVPLAMAVAAHGCDTAAVQAIVADAMARPGTIRSLPAEAGQPEPLGDAAGALALALCNSDTMVWLGAGLRDSAVAGWIPLRTGAPLTREKAEARLAFVEAGAALASFSLFSPGTATCPEVATTLVLEVDAFGSGRMLALSGPGIARTASVGVQGLPDMFLRRWNDNHALFPRGIDVVLTAGRDMLCLPRTTRIIAR